MNKKNFIVFCLISIAATPLASAESKPAVAFKRLRAAFKTAETPKKQYLLKTGMWDCKTYTLTDNGVQAEPAANTFLFEDMSTPAVDLLSRVEGAKTAGFFRYTKQGDRVSRSDLMGHLPAVRLLEVVRKAAGKNILITEFSADRSSLPDVAKAAPYPVFANTMMDGEQKEDMKANWGVMNYRACKPVKQKQ